MLTTRQAALDALEDERAGYALDAFASVVAIVAAVLAILVIRRISRTRHRDRLSRRAARPWPAARDRLAW